MFQVKVNKEKRVSREMKTSISLGDGGGLIPHGSSRRRQQLHQKLILQQQLPVLTTNNHIKQNHIKEQHLL